MADFRTHITVSSLCGCAVAGAGVAWGAPTASCVLAGGLCGLAGMLPDLDSNNSLPLREVLAFSSAVVPLLMVKRFIAIGLSHEEVALAGAIVYLMVRFGIGGLLKRCTVHRGMFHSLPAALIAGLAAFLICDSLEPRLRFYKAGAIFLGYVSHLLLDEFWSTERNKEGVRLKKSFGTAFKLASGEAGGTSAAYGMLLLLTLLAIGDTMSFQEGLNDLPPVPIAADQIETIAR